ncbi:MAG: TetR/AcrR family transcriptional regulator [Rhodobacterales bacterium]|nr:TetR/AcrR family transcriptional regulator [Rhodobacterales bacterium]
MGMTVVQTRATPRKGRKYDQVLDGAREVFLVAGFEGASVDDIARAAGVSKATLYSYFPDKRLMFSEMAERECSRQAAAALQLIDMSAPPSQVLRLAAHRLVRILLSDFSQRIFRVCVAEADRFPELGRAFYESGPALGRARIMDYLSQAAARGEVAIDDMELAADQFIELCKADLWTRAVFGIQSSFTDADIERVIEGAVTTFLARYGAPR